MFAFLGFLYRDSQEATLGAIEVMAMMQTVVILAVSVQSLFCANFKMTAWRRLLGEHKRPKKAMFRLFLINLTASAAKYFEKEGRESVGFCKISSRDQVGC